MNAMVDVDYINWMESTIEGLAKKLNIPTPRYKESSEEPVVVKNATTEPILPEDFNQGLIPSVLSTPSIFSSPQQKEKEFINGFGAKKEETPEIDITNPPITNNSMRII